MIGGEFLRILSSVLAKNSAERQAAATKNAEPPKQVRDALKEWVVGATSGDGASRNKTKKEAYSQIKGKEYQVTLTDARSSSETTKSVVIATGRKIPDFLPKTVDEIPTVSIARLVEHVVSAHDKLQNDPNFLVWEAYKADMATKWAELTFEETNSAREIINGVYQRALDVAAAQKGSAHITNLGDVETLWKTLDDRPDFYNTEKLNDKDSSGNSYNDSEKRQHERLDQLLRDEQEIINNLHPQNPEDGIKALKALKEKIARGKVEKQEFKVDKKSIKETLYRKEEAEPVLEKIQSIIDELEAEVAQNRSAEATEQESKDQQDAYRGLDDLNRPIEEIRSEIFANAQSGSVRAIAKQIFDKYGSFTPRELEDIWNRLNTINNSGLFVDDLKEGLKEVLRRNPTNDELQVAKVPDVLAIRELKTLLRHEATRLRAEGRPGERSFFENGERKYKLNGQWVSNREYMQNFTISDVDSRATYRELDKMLFEGILSSADNNKRVEFGKAFSFWKEAEYDNFMSLLRGRLHELQKMGGNLSDGQVREILNRFTRLRELKEAYHNFYMLLHTGDKETMVKYSASFLAEDLDFMYDNIPGVGYAQRAMESVINQISADNDGVLPPEVMSNNSGVLGASVFERKFYSEFERKINSKGISELSGMEPWEKNLALECAIGAHTINMRLPELLTQVKGARDFRSSHWEGLKLDSIRGLFVKFQASRPGSIFFWLITGDAKTSLDMWKNPNNWSLNRILEEYYIKSEDPRFEDRIAFMRNVLDVSSRFGRASGWGNVAMMQKFSQEEMRHRGFSLEIRDAEEEIVSKFKSIIGKELGDDVSDLRKNIYISTRMEKVQTGEKLEIARGVKMTLEEAIEKEIERIYARVANENPLALARRMVDDRVAHRYSVKHLNEDASKRASLRVAYLSPEERSLRDYRLEAIEKILGPERLKELLEGLGGGPLHVKTQDFELDITNLAELWMATPANRSDASKTPQHLPGSQEVRVRAARERVQKFIDELESNLSLVQDKRFNRIHKALDRLKKGEIDRMTESSSITDADYEILRMPESSREQRKVDDIVIKETRLYAELIKKAATERVVDEKSHLPDKKSSYVERFAHRNVKGKEKYLTCTTDMPYEKFYYAAMGGRALVRGWADAYTNIKGQLGTGDVFEQFYAHPDLERMGHLLKEKVYIPISADDPIKAQKWAYTVAQGIVKIYSERGLYSNSGPIGDFLNLPLITDVLDKYHLNAWLSGLSKVFIDHNADVMGPNKRWKFIHFLNGINVLAKDPLPWEYGAGWGYTARHLEKETKSTPWHVALEIGSYFPIGFPLIMIVVGIAEALEKEKQK